MNPPFPNADDAPSTVVSATCRAALGPRGHLLHSTCALEYAAGSFDLAYTMIRRR
jgi:hypothetical protein